MATKESNILAKIMLALSGKAVLFRNNRGVLKDREGRSVRYGVGPNGASDLIGYKTVTVTPEMVGKRVAIFTAIEVKPPTGKVSAEQVRFNDAVQRAGGISGVARSESEAVKILER